ncbi:MAG: M28 family metallopeptidase [Polyangiaceae bacterium]|jgi:hypothetical protein|nr:M28 family metallopeptidase [Polyangiaceae bacterium]
MDPAGNDVVATLHWLAGLAPTRLTGTPDEERVQKAIAGRLERRGYQVSWHPFAFPPHIYGSLALHFGLALLLAGLAGAWPLAAGVGHLIVAFSFFSEAVLRRHVLRGLWPEVQSRNLLATLPAEGAPRRRIVLLAHVDSAFTGLMFHPPILKAIAKPPPSFLPFLKKQLLLPLVCVLLLAAIELLQTGAPVWLRVALCIPVALVFLLNAEVVLRNQVVPGAADNLSGCAAQIVLAEAWADEAPGDVEVVFAFTGAEEAGTGGAAHLARTMGWDPKITEVLVLDTLSNGELFVLEEGELFRVPIPPSLFQEARLAALDVGLPPPEPYAVPAGATDALPFLVEGYRAMALTCLDREQHAPRNYHHPLDTADRVDPDQLRASTRLAAQLLRRLGRP